MRPRVVLDTNTLLQAVPEHGRYHPIYRGLKPARFDLVVSSEILLEYGEIFGRLGASGSWRGVSRVLDLLRRSGTVTLVDPTYRWTAIAPDPDDDKFVDAAVVGGAEFIVTDDHHFDALLAGRMLQVRPLSPADFLAMLPRP